MNITVEQSYADRFQEILDEEQIGDPAVFLDVDVFDEVPVYSRFHQLDFLSGLSFAEANGNLIRLTALYLDRVVSYAANQERQDGKTILRMVSITGWLNENYSGQMNLDGSADFVRPNIWLANLDSPKLSSFSVWPAASPAGLFVIAAMNNDDRFAVVQGAPERFGAPSPARVYIYMLGSEGADRLRLNSSS
jgi:Immunity protein 15